VTDYRITRFFGGSNRRRCTTEVTAYTEENQNQRSAHYPVFPRVVCSKDFVLPPKLHGNARADSHMRSRGGRLLPRQSAADRFQFEASVLCGFHRAANSFADE
jgi:hypothetical protein